MGTVDFVRWYDIKVDLHLNMTN